MDFASLLARRSKAMEESNHSNLRIQIVRGYVTMRSVVRIAMVSLIGLFAGAAQAQDAVPFPPDAKYGYVSVQRVLAESTEGQAANARVQQLTEQKIAEIDARNQQLGGAIEGNNQQLLELQEKLAQGQNVMSAQARVALEREISRLQLDVQRQAQDAQAEMESVQQDAEAEVGALQQQLQVEFEQRLAPTLEQVATEHGLDLIFSIEGLIWGRTGLDLTQSVIDSLNATVETP